MPVTHIPHTLAHPHKHTHSHGHMPPEAKGPSCTFPVYCGRQQTVLSSRFPVLIALLSILFSAAQFSLFAIADGSSTLKTNAKFVENTRTHTHTQRMYSDSESDLDADSVRNIRQKCLNLPRDPQLAKYAKLFECV